MFRPSRETFCQSHTNLLRGKQSCATERCPIIKLRSHLRSLTSLQNVTERSERGSKPARWVVIHSERHIPQAAGKWVSVAPLASGVDSDIRIYPNLANTGHSPKPTEHRSSFSPLHLQRLPKICWIGRVFREKKKDEIPYKRLCLHLASEGFAGWKSGECLRRIIKINSSASDVECSAGTVFTPVALCFQLTRFWSNGCYPKIYINNKYSEKFRFPGLF